MRELILRHAHAARKHGSFTATSSPLLIAVATARSNHPTVSHIQYIRHKSTKPASTSSPTSATGSAPVSGSVPTGGSSPAQPSGARYGKATTFAPPSSHLPIYEQFDQPELSLERDLAVPGIVKDLTSTRPPPLLLPEPPHPHAWPRKGNWDPKRWDFKYLFSLGKAYGKFYWTGVKQLYGNFKIMFRINKELNGTFPDAAARYAAVPEKISYNDYEMMIRTRRDMRKTIPFLIIFAICGEFTPLVILAFGSKVVPGTCVIPKQVLQDRKKTLERDDTYMKEVAVLLRKNNGDLGHVRGSRKDFIELQNLIAYQAGLTPFKKLPPVIGGLYYHFRTQRNLARHCDELLSVAALVRREGGWAKKSPQDMWEWGNKYGLYRLRQWTRAAMASNEDPVSEKMKKALLPYFEAEVDNIFSEDFRSIPRISHCTIALNSPLYHRPDIDLRNKEVAKLAGLQTAPLPGSKASIPKK